jgi:hypothetical protein
MFLSFMICLVLARCAGNANKKLREWGWRGGYSRNFSTRECGRRDLNPHEFPRRNLNPVRLPVPPPPHRLFMSSRARAAQAARNRHGIQVSIKRASRTLFFLAGSRLSPGWRLITNSSGDIHIRPLTVAPYKSDSRLADSKSPILPDNLSTGPASFGAGALLF